MKNSFFAIFALISLFLTSQAHAQAPALPTWDPQGGAIKLKKHEDISIFLNCVLRADIGENAPCAFYEFVYENKSDPTKLQKFGSSITLDVTQAAVELDREFDIKNKQNLVKPRYYSTTRDAYGNIVPMVKTSLSSVLPGGAGVSLILKAVGAIAWGEVLFFTAGAMGAVFATPVLIDSVKFPFQWFPYAIKARKIKRMNRALTDALPFLLDSTKIGTSQVWVQNRFGRLIKSFESIWPSS